MTLDEAIRHAKMSAEMGKGECAEQHKQLAGWLMELKELRKLKAMSLTDGDIVVLTYLLNRIDEWRQVSVMSAKDIGDCLRTIIEKLRDGSWN